VVESGDDFPEAWEEDVREPDEEFIDVCELALVGDEDDDDRDDDEVDEDGGDDGDDGDDDAGEDPPISATSLTKEDHCSGVPDTLSERSVMYTAATPRDASSEITVL